MLDCFDEGHKLELIHQVAVLIIVIHAWIMMLQKRLVRHDAFPPLNSDLMLPRDQERIANLNDIYNCNDVEAIQMLRMGRAPFYALVKMYWERGLLQDSIHTFVEEQVDMFLHVVGHNQMFRVIHSTFRRSMDAI
jgi:hypothetical protein